MTVGCLTRTQIIKGNNGRIVNNDDGSLTVYIPNSRTGIQTPMLLTKPCCEALNSNDYPTYFDVDTQQCKYQKTTTSSAINIVLNPKGGDGEWFTVNPDETCTLSIDFDYLFKFNCNSLNSLVSTDNGIVNMFENISASMILDIKPTSTSLTKVYEESVFTPIGMGNAFNYFSTATTNSGFYVCGGLAENIDDTSCYPLNLYSLKLVDGTLDCSDVQHQIINSLFTESGLATTATTEFKAAINENAFSSNWLHFHTEITDQSILSAITNQKIVLTFRVSGFTGDISVLFDNIVLNKTCTAVESNSIFVTQSPGFELDRIKDNKKSWATKDTVDHRTFHIGRYDNSNQIRQTDYFVNFDDRQVINSKEIDLDIDIAAAVESDVWCYLSDNPCLLTGTTVGTTTCVGEIYGQVYTAQTITGYSSTLSIMTSTTITGLTCGLNNYTLVPQIISCPAKKDLIGTGYTSPCAPYTGQTAYTQTIYIPIPNPSTYCCSDSCGDKPIDINNLLTQPLSAVTTIEDFEYYLTSELIDVKDRQSISSYPTLRLLYDRYKNSLAYCGTKSSAFDYFTMDKFSKLIGNYWVDLVEQVIPATTIWGSTKIYTNTIFDNQKYKYKAYTSLFGINLNNQKVLSPTSGENCKVDVVTTVIKGQSTNTLEFLNEGNVHEYNNIYLIQMNSSPEYIGNVNIIGSGPSTPQVIVECTLRATISNTTNASYGVNNGTATATAIGAQGPVSYLWSNGQNTKTATGLSGGTYSVTITDSVCSDTAEVTVSACTVSVNFNVINPNYLSNNGSITATTTNAQGPVTYQWNNGNTTNILTGLTSSTYTVTVTDNICSNTQSVTLNDITNFAWRAYDTNCEKETTFTVRKTITGLSSSSLVFYDTDSTKVWVADQDNYLKGNVYWFDPITATTESDMHYVRGLSADSLYSTFIDETYKRIYFVGTNTIGGTNISGLTVYDINSSSFYQIPYGSSAAYYRIPLFVSDTKIYVVDKSTSPVTIKSVNRATLTSVSTFTTVISDNGFNEQVQFYQVGDKIWTIMYNTTSQMRVYVFDSNFNPLNIKINGTTNSYYYIGNISFGSGVCRPGLFYDEDYDTVYISDIGGNQKIIITGTSANSYTAGTATTYSMTNYIVAGKTNVQVSWSIDPVSNKLYENCASINSVGDLTAIHTAYEVNRSTHQYTKMYNFAVNNVKSVNDGLSDSLMAANANVVWWNNHSSSIWNTDGTIVFYNNSLSGGTTGLVDIITTEKYDTLTNKSYVPLTISANTYGGANYITTPYFTTTGDCAINYTFTCPIAKWSTGIIPTFEMSLNKSVATNPNLTKIVISGYTGLTPVSNRIILSGTSGFTQYTMTTLTGGTSSIDSAKVIYYSGGPVSYTQVNSCTLSNFST